MTRADGQRGRPIPDATVRLGIVGACGCGAAFKAACDEHPAVRVEAVCDSHAGGLYEAAVRPGASESFTDYDEMLSRADIDWGVQHCCRPLKVSAPGGSLTISDSRPFRGRLL